MNKGRRRNLIQASGLLDSAIVIIRDAARDEQECMDNLPENLQNSERYEAMDAAIDHLEDALVSLDEAKAHISEAVR